MHRSTVLRTGVILTLVALASGCVTYHAGEDNTYELKRRFNGWETVVPRPIEEVHAAVEAGLADLHIDPFISRFDKLTGLADGIFSDGSDYTVTLEALGDDITSIRIRCGMFGDRKRAKRLFAAFARHW